MGGGKGDKSSLDGTTPLRLKDHPYLTPINSPAVQPGSGSKFDPLETREQVTACVHTPSGRASISSSSIRRARHRRPGRQSDRSGNAAFLSPLRAGPALRCSGKARLRDRPLPENELNPIHPIPEVIPGLRAPRIKRGQRATPPTVFARLAVTSRSKHTRMGNRCLFRWPFGRLNVQRGAADRAQELRIGLPSARLHPAPEHRKRD